MIRQGDILLRPVPAPQKYDAGAPLTQLVLAEGEATGHAHALIADRPSILAATVGGRALLHLLEGVSITHPDHDPSPRPVPPGWYEVIRQRIYTPSAPRIVRD